MSLVIWSRRSILLVSMCLTRAIHGRRIQTSVQAESHRSVSHLSAALSRFLQANHLAAAFGPPLAVRSKLCAQAQLLEAWRGRPDYYICSPVASVMVDDEDLLRPLEEDEDLLRQLEEELAALEVAEESSPLNPGDAPEQLVDCGSRSIPILVPEQDALAEALIAKAHAIAIEDEDQYDENMRLQVESMMSEKPGYWAQLWPCGVVLSKRLLERPSLVAGGAVLDLGAGLGLCSVCAALAGAESVLAADNAADACAFIAANAARNNVSGIVDTANLDWEDPGLLAGATFDTVCCSDVLYSEDAPRLIARLLEQAVRSSGIVLLADNADRPYEDARRTELMHLLVETGKFELIEKNSHFIELETAQGISFTVETLALRRLSC